MRALFVTIIFLVASTVLSLALFAGGKAIFQEGCRDIITKAIEAHGGAERLTKYRACKIKAKGCMIVAHTNIPFTVVHCFQAPDKVRLVQNFIATSPTVQRTGQIVQVTTVARCKTILQDGNKLRLFIDGREIIPVPDDEVVAINNALHVQNVSRLVSLLDGTAYTLTLAGEIKVCGRPARGVKVSIAGKTDVTLYFDKGTFMLVKAEYMGHDPGGQAAMMEEIYMNYKEARGVMYPSRTEVYINNQKTCTYEVLEFLPMEKFDPSEFAAP